MALIDGELPCFGKRLLGTIKERVNGSLSQTVYTENRPTCYIGQALFLDFFDFSASAVMAFITLVGDAHQSRLHTRIKDHPRASRNRGLQTSLSMQDSDDAKASRSSSTPTRYLSDAGSYIASETRLLLFPRLTSTVYPSFSSRSLICCSTETRL